MLLAVKCIAVDESSQLDGKITEQIKKQNKKLRNKTVTETTGEDAWLTSTITV